MCFFFLKPSVKKKNNPKNGKEHVKNISVQERTILRHWSASCLPPCSLAGVDAVNRPDIAQEQWWHFAWVAKERHWPHLPVTRLISSFKQKSHFLTKCICSLCLSLFFEHEFGASAVFTEDPGTSVNLSVTFLLSVTDVGKIIHYLQIDHRGPNSAFSHVCKLAVVICLIVKGCKSVVIFP